MSYAARTILFDLDGTLLDSTELILQCFSHAWERVCGFSHSRDALVQTFGAPLRDAMTHLLTRVPKENNVTGDSDQDRIQRLLCEYASFNVANHDTLARPFRDACKVVAELRRRGYQIAVVTSKGRELGLRGLKLCSLDTLINAAVFLEDTTLHKPHPEPIMNALQKLDAPSRSAVYVGDSRFDMIAAKAAGVRAVAALWGPTSAIELERERPDFCARSITDLLEIFS